MNDIYQAGDEAYISSKSRNKITHVTDVLSEVQEWAIKDNQSPTLNENIMTSESRRELRNAGSVCGLWETFYICVGSPILLTVTKNILLPFRDTPYPDWANLWWIVLWVLFSYPILNFAINLVCLLKIRGPMSRKAHEIFLMTRAAFIFLFSLFVCVFYFWLIPTLINRIYNGNGSFCFYVIEHFGDFLRVCHFIFTESIKYISLFSMLTAFIPLLLLYIHKLIKSTNRELADEFGISRKNITE